MVCPPVPASFNLDQSDQEQDDSKTEESGSLNEVEDTRSACLAPVAAMQCSLSIKAVKGDVAVQGCVGEFTGGEGPGEQAAADDGRWQPARVLEQARPLQKVRSQILLLQLKSFLCK